MRVFSDLNLHGNSPARVQPEVGEWGPRNVPSTPAKKRMRIWVTLALIAAITALFLLGTYFYKALTGQLG